MESLPALLLSFTGTLLAFLVTKTVEYVLQRKFAASELARDALVDFASTITNLEGAIESLRQEPELKAPADLPRLPSEYRRAPPTISVERLLAGFSDEKLHRSMMLFFNRHKLFVERSDERKIAFYWLLDNPTVEWSEARAVERVEIIRQSTPDLIAYTLDMLRFSFDIMERLYDVAQTGVNPLRSDFTDTQSFLRSTYGLSRDEISLRRAYYSSEYLLGRTTILPRFNPQIDYEKTVWNDEFATKLDPRGGRLILNLSVESAEPFSIALRPFVEIAVPRGATVRAARILYRQTDGSFTEREIPARFRQDNTPHAQTRVRVEPNVGKSIDQFLDGSTRADTGRRVRLNGDGAD